MAWEDFYDSEHKQKVMEQNAEHTLLFYEKNINIYKHICVCNQYLAELQRTSLFACLHLLLQTSLIFM